MLSTGFSDLIAGSVTCTLDLWTSKRLIYDAATRLHLCWHHKLIVLTLKHFFISMGRNPFQISYYFKRRFYSAAFLLQLSFNTVTGRVVTVWVDGWLWMIDVPLLSSVNQNDDKHMVSLKKGTHFTWNTNIFSQSINNDLRLISILYKNNTLGGKENHVLSNKYECLLIRRQ